MSRMPEITTSRRSPLGGGPVPGTLLPGELFLHMAQNGTATLYAGDRTGRPQAISGGGTGGGVAPTVPTAKPNMAAPGDLWLDEVEKALKVFSGAANDWITVMDDAALLRHDGTRPATGDLDMDGNDLDNVGTLKADAVDGATINGGSF